MRRSPSFIAIDLFGFDYTKIVVIDPNRVGGDGDLCRSPYSIKVGVKNL